MIQYPKNTHVTLPAISGGFGSMNIMKDPPKSIQTYYKPNVFEDNRLLEWLADDTTQDRICENINPYARGVNQMVSVSYDNYSANGGQYRDLRGSHSANENQSLSSSRPNASLPYKVNYNFRPDNYQARNLMPLSKLNRIFPIQTNPSDEKRFFDNLTNCKTDLKAVRNELLNVCCNTRATLNIETPQAKPQEIAKVINQNPIKPIAVTSDSKPSAYLQINKIPTKGLQEIQQTPITSNVCSSNPNATPLNFRGNQKMPIKDLTNISCQSNPKLMGESQNMMNTDMHLSRNLPSTSFMINPGTKNVDLNSNIQSRTVNLAPRLVRGGFQNAGKQLSGQVREAVHFQRNADYTNKNVYQHASKLSEQRNSVFKPFE